ncbi:uncharacterized protein LOC112493904 [Cephus cinctus]|uniref:Uncharacterized protein LOC112493904 n=1 Tax=Cephus cinctus TaxID=211228 RepID=A0AAJ7RB59_CEPCN|nr:uncharacterized protein LOC112493904 [Cephus cinctus]
MADYTFNQLVELQWQRNISPLRNVRHVKRELDLATLDHDTGYHFPVIYTRAPKGLALVSVIYRPQLLPAASHSHQCQFPSLCPLLFSRFLFPSPRGVPCELSLPSVRHSRWRIFQSPARLLHLSGTKKLRSPGRCAIYFENSHVDSLSATIVRRFYNFIGPAKKEHFFIVLRIARYNFHPETLPEINRSTRVTRINLAA